MIDTVVIVHDQSFVSGGAAKIAIEEAKEFKKNNYRVIYFAALGPADETLKESGIEVYCIGGEHIGNTKNIRAFIRAIWNKKAEDELYRLLCGLDGEKTIVHIHGWTKCLSASVFSACIKANIRTYVTLHDYFIICQNGGLYNYKRNCICNNKPGSIGCYCCNCDKKNYIQKVYRNIRQLFLQFALKKCNPRKIYISNFSKSIFESNDLNFSNGTIIENYVEIINNEQVAVSENTSYVFIGRVSDEKNPKLFCEAITKSNVPGVVIGDGPLLEKLKQEYPNITFTGWLSPREIQKHLDKARCMVVTSKLYETMGLTVIEMQARGIPCIVPDQFAGSDYLKDTDTGVVYLNNNLESLMRAIDVTKSADYIKKLGDAFYNSYDSNRFSKETYVSRLKEIFEGIA